MRSNKEEIILDIQDTLFSKYDFDNTKDLSQNNLCNALIFRFERVVPFSVKFITNYF